MINFQDIPQFTSDGSYQVDVPLSYVPEAIARYIKEYRLNMDPDFQRAHVWTEEQQRRYMEFILRGGRSGRVIYFNCPGWQRLSRPGELVLVDGKQRLEACLKFFGDELAIFNGHKHSDFTGRCDLLCALKFNINNLATRGEVLQWYLDLNDGGVVHTTEELDKVRKLLAVEVQELSGRKRRPRKSL